MISLQKRCAIFSLAAIHAISGCTKSEDGSESGGSGGGNGDNTKSAFSTSCGTVSGGKLQNPASPSDGFRSPITVLGPNLLSVTLPTGPLMVKLHGLDAPYGSKGESAKAYLQALAVEEGIFIPADRDCTASLEGGVGALGQVFTASGKSYSESLITRGLASLESDPCGGDLLSTCYGALKEDTDSKIAGEVGRLLWKPVSDSNGKLAVHTEPYGTTVKVNGEIGTNQGGGNGYGSLARFTKPGCAYGASVRVQVLDEKGAAYTVNGATEIIIPSGCARTCVEGPTIKQCSKS